MSAITAIFLSILSLHFLRILAGNVYRAAVAFTLPAEKFAVGILQKEASFVITKGERLKFFLHALLSS